MGNSGSSSSNLPSCVDRGVPIEIFNVAYIGSVPVKRGNGADVVQGAVQRLLSLKTKSRPVILMITTVGLYIIDKITGDTLKDLNIRDISFSAVDGDNSKLVSFFESNRVLRLITCHTFHVNKDAFRVCVAVNDAFKILSGEMAAPVAEIGTDTRTLTVIRKKISKEKAIEESLASVQTMDKGNLKESFNGIYFGFCLLSIPKGDVIATESKKRILQQDNIPVNVVIALYDKAIVVEDASDGSAYVINSILDISFIHLNDAKNEAVFILHDPRLDKITAYYFSIDITPPDQPSVRRQVDILQKAQRVFLEEQQKKRALEGGDADTSTSLATEAEQETGIILGTYEASYIGVVPIQDIQGLEVVNKALAIVEKSSKSTQGVFIQVGVDFIRTLDSLSHDTVSTFIIKDISFTTVAGDLQDVFAFIQHNESTNTNFCHLYRAAGERSFDIALAFNEAFKLAAAELKKNDGNPFKASGARYAPEGILFKNQVHRADLVARRAIGAGQYGQVYLAEQMMGSEGGGIVREPRAVKMLRGGASDDDRKDFVIEAETMLNLANPMLVSIVGVVMQQRPWLMVLEYLKYGDLGGVLKGCKTKNIVLTTPEMLHLSNQIAKGMVFMSSCNYIHMDLAARNCLLGENNVVKVADFGLTKKIWPGETCWKSKDLLTLPIKWCAIEALDSRTFSQASDVWSFGVVLWEIFSYGAVPYREEKLPEIQRKVREGLRLAIPANCSRDIYQIMQTCWMKNPDNRPLFKNLDITLSAKFQTYMSEGYTDIRDVGRLASGPAH